MQKKKKLNSRNEVLEVTAEYPLYDHKTNQEIKEELNT
jgi:hypothetical protein